MDYIRLFIYNKRLLSFGFLLTFCSGFGKTFLLSIYVPDFLREFSLSNTEFGLLYALTTIASGVLLLYFGKLIDSTKLKKYTLYVSIGLILSCVLVTLSHSVVLLAIGLFGLRLTGQGLMNHTSLTAMTRYFNASRGKAITIAVLGHPIGVAILPLLVATLKNLYGWRNAMVISSVFLALILLPMILSLFKRKPKAIELQSNIERKKKEKKYKSNWTIGKILSDKKFYFLAPSTLVLGFLSTGLLFYIVPMGLSKGWTELQIASSFFIFAITSTCATIFTGKLIDQFKAVRIFPFYLLPLALGMAMMINSTNYSIGLLYLGLLGTSLGMGISLESALVAEIYGVKNLGTVRSIFAMLVTFSTALGPLIMGILFDADYTFDFIFEFGMVFVFIAVLLSLKVKPKFVRIKEFNKKILRWFVPQA